MNKLTFDTAITIAHGCKDYGGGHHSDGHMEAYQHGIQTVINALEAAAKTPEDTQVNALRRIGNALRNLPATIEEPASTQIPRRTCRCCGQSYQPGRWDSNPNLCYTCLCKP